MAALASVLLMAATRAPAAQAPGGEEIHVTADKLEAGDGSAQIQATGNVEIKRGTMTLKADEARVNRVTKDAEAKGKVSVDDPQWKVKSADLIQMNMDQETGEIHNGDLFVEDGHISMAGRRFQKFGGQTYHVDDGFFTTCLCESGAPSWKLSAEQMDLAANGVGSLRNGYFYVFDVPVLYIPYAYFPLRSERQSGFLFPSLGHSTRDGFRLLQPFFWAISKSADATVSFDLETRTRYGFLGEFRNLFDRSSDFSVHGSYFNEAWRTAANTTVVDRTIADQDIRRDRWSVLGTHRYLLPSDWLTFSDFAVYRDDLFTRELIDRFDLPGTRESDIRRSRYGESRFGVFRNWGDAFFQSHFNFYQDFIQPDSTTFLRSPQVSFWGRRLLANFPLEFRWRAEGVNYLRRADGDGLRLDLRPEVLLPFRWGSRLFGSVAVAPRETVYHLYTTVNSSDRNLSRELVEIRGSVGTAVGRVFAFNALGLSHIRHVLEPEIGYLFVPGVSQKNIPIMDEIDRVRRRNVLTFALANRFWGKIVNPLAVPPPDSSVEALSPVTTGDVRQMASLRLALSYDIDRERKGGDSLTDLDINLKLTPLSFIDLSFDGGVDPGAWRTSQARVALNLTDPRPILRRALDPDFNRPNAISFSYQYLRRGPNGFLADNANVVGIPDCTVIPLPSSLEPWCSGKNTVGNLGGSILYKPHDNLLFTFNSTYDARDSRFIGYRIVTKFLSFCECWTATLGVSHAVNPKKTSVSFDFSLLGLGNTKSSLK